MKDIQTREDIDGLVRLFYEKLLTDKRVAFLFTEVVEIHLESHLPVIADFWETVLLGNIVHKGDVMGKHLVLNEKHPLTEEHFSVWLHHWEESVRFLYTGDVAEEAIKRAKTIASLMKFKVGVMK